MSAPSLEKLTGREGRRDATAASGGYRASDIERDCKRGYKDKGGLCMSWQGVWILSYCNRKPKDYFSQVNCRPRFRQKTALIK